MIIPGITFKSEIIKYTHPGIETPMDSAAYVKKYLEKCGLGEWFIKLLIQTESCIAGGFILHMVARILHGIEACGHHNPLCNFGDIDIFLPNISSITYFENTFNRREIKYTSIRTENSISVNLKNKGIVVQFILGNANLDTFLHTFDIPIAAMLFNGNNLLMTKEAVFELYHGIHVNKYKNSSCYINRLSKYSIGLGKRRGKNIKIFIPYYYPLNMRLTNFSLNDLWRIAHMPNCHRCSYYEFGGTKKFCGSIADNILRMGMKSVISNYTFCRDGKSKLSHGYVDFKYDRGEFFDKVAKFSAKVMHLKDYDMGPIDYKISLLTIKAQTELPPEDLYNDNDLRVKLECFPKVLSGIICQYIGNTIVDIRKLCGMHLDRETDITRETVVISYDDCGQCDLNKALDSLHIAPCKE